MASWMRSHHRHSPNPPTTRFPLSISTFICTSHSHLLPPVLPSYLFPSAAAASAHFLHSSSSRLLSVPSCCLSSRGHLLRSQHLLPSCSSSSLLPSSTFCLCCCYPSTTTIHFPNISCHLHKQHYTTWIPPPNPTAATCATTATTSSPLDSNEVSNDCSSSPTTTTQFVSSHESLLPDTSSEVKNNNSGTTADTSSSSSSFPPVEDVLPTLPVRRFSANRVPGQVLYPATEEDIQILSKSKRKFPRPFDCEGSVIIRLVRLTDPVTSPVARTVRNNEYGIRGKERWGFLAYGLFATTWALLLCSWQLDRMQWKKNMIELRRQRLAMPRVTITGSPFPWALEGGAGGVQTGNEAEQQQQVIDCNADGGGGGIDEWAYRTVEIRGVLDPSQEVRIGPRPGMTIGNPGYLIVCPLRLSDGSTIMVNRGHCAYQYVDRLARGDIPEWVTIRAVVEPGEIANTMVLFNFFKRLRNHPEVRKFTFLEPRDLGSVSGAKNLEECKLAVLNAYDILYDDDVGLLETTTTTTRGEGGGGSDTTVGNNFGTKRKRVNVFEMRQKGDYLVFWADEHTHFNYAMQWLMLGGVFLSMTAFRFFQFTRWKF
eukprot:GHVS01071486.1.p1 GENE.GHVS01071486.1~~GHVS01071486.1.p1  ORF type:complete len:597 (+),score=122.21 GHVS01071486.1:796-2586(+)